MKVIVSVCVYNRFQNIKRWIECWQKCNTEHAELIIIHNHYGDQSELNKYKKLCDDNSIKYVPRNGQGFDIGAFQDVCKERLAGFPNDWQYLLWCCDDTFPMSKSFVKPFIDSFQNPNIGVSCMKISASVSPHVRTTGFCIRKEISKLLKFQVDPIKTKTDCYFFEHRGGDKTFTNQVRKMGLSCVMVAPDNISPLWDSGYWKRLDRMAEHDRVFGTAESVSDKVVFICPIFEMYPQIISSLLCQTHTNWELILIYNGPCDNNLPELIRQADDKRIKFIEYPEATGKWGHELRKWALNELKEGRLSENVGYVVIQNADNYLTPRYTEYLLKGFDKSHTTVATYCSDTVHSYKNWQVLPAKLERGYLDCGAVMVKKEVACEVGWNSLEHSSDWLYFEDIARQYSWSNFVKINGVLFVHN